MYPLHLCHADVVGGAARAAYRLNDGLRRIGIDSEMLVLRKTGDDPSVRELQGIGADLMRWKGYRIDHLPLAVYRQPDRSAAWSTNLFPHTRRWPLDDADLVHLHWIGHGFIPIPMIHTSRQPLIWTLHDSWAFTGGCHLPYACRRYENACGSCPLLNSRLETDLSRVIWNCKQHSYPAGRMHIIAPSVWLAGCARRSSLLGHADIRIIPYGLDLDVFRPLKRAEARALLGLPQDRPLVAFGAMSALTERNKGADLLIEALGRLDPDADLLIFGSDRIPEGLSRTAHAAGVLTDEARIAAIYAAADVMVVPSRSENLPLTVMEPLACGTPVVAFRIGGIPDLIEHKVNGYLAEPYDTADLARGIAWVLEDPERHARLRAAARSKAEREYEITHIARRYLALYEEVLAGAH